MIIKIFYNIINVIGVFESKYILNHIKVVLL